MRRGSAAACPMRDAKRQHQHTSPPASSSALGPRHLLACGTLAAARSEHTMRCEAPGIGRRGARGIGARKASAECARMSASASTARQSSHRMDTWEPLIVIAPHTACLNIRDSHHAASDHAHATPTPRCPQRRQWHGAASGCTGRGRHKPPRSHRHAGCTEPRAIALPCCVVATARNPTNYYLAQPRWQGGRHHGERPTLRQAKGAGAPAANRAASCAASACSCPAVQSGPAAHVSRRGRAVTREASRRPQARCATAFSPCPMRPQRGKTRRRCELAAARSWGCCACTND
jgi:hypothetical protein